MSKAVRRTMFLIGFGLAVAAPALAQTVPPGTTGNPAASRPSIPGAVSPSNPDAASRPQVQYQRVADRY